MYHVIMNDSMKTRKVLSCMAITAIIKNKITICVLRAQSDNLSIERLLICLIFSKSTISGVTIDKITALFRNR
jgi:hypothetical protein